MAKFMFVTKAGMVKKVDGSEFQAGKRTIVATKLHDDDKLVSVRVVNDKQQVVLQTASGYFLRFPATELAEMKKNTQGQKGIKLQKNDEVENAYLFEEGKETKVSFKGKELSLNRLKASKRGATGLKQRG